MNIRQTVPRRIALCITELEPGGAERCLVELACRLDGRQFEPVVYCLAPRPSGNPTSLADVLEQRGIRVYALGARTIRQFPAVLARLQRHFIADPPQIVQTFLFHANVLGTLAAHRAGVPHVVTGIRVAERRRGWHRTLERWTSRWAQRHVCVSEGVKRFARDQTVLPAEKLVVIPNGVDAARFASAQPRPLADLGIGAGRHAIACVGRLDEQKGVAWLLRLFPRVLAAFDQHDLLLVGDGPQRSALERLVAELGLRGRVHFLGFRRDVPEILAASDLVVLGSRWEGMANVVLEAMASGKPVVATDVEGVAEMLGAKTPWQVARPNDAEAFVHRIFAILDDASLAAELGAANRRRAAQDFSIGAMVAAYERLYRAL